jgi:hypothetical protein
VSLAALAVAAATAMSPAAARGGGGGGHGHGHGHFHRGHVGAHIGIVIGAPLVAWPVYRHYYPAPVVIREEPRVYIEKADAPEAAPAQGTWYYCRSSEMYYPYTQACPGGWEAVPAQPSR